LKTIGPVRSRGRRKLGWTHHTLTWTTRCYVDEIYIHYGVDIPERAYEAV
jgi:hypothetical protein